MSRLAFRKKLQQGVSIALMTVLLLAGGSAAALAYTTEEYQVDVKVGEDNSFQFTESITVDFDGLQHGIFRYIPVKGSGGLTALKIDRINVDGWTFDKYMENNNQVLKIGDPDHYLTGRQIFTFGYRLRVYDDKDTRGDMLYIDLLPTNWETPLEKAEIRLHLPKAIEARYIELYASGYGSDGAVDNFSWNYDEESMELYIEGSNIPQGVGVTVYCPLPEGYWSGQLNNDWAAAAAISSLLFGSLAICLLWFFFGRDRKIVETVEFYPPQGLNPAEIGYILDGMADQKDLLSLIPYYAHKGYLSMTEYEKDKFELHKLRDIDEEEKLFARTFFQGLFAQGERVRLDDLGEDFSTAYLTAFEQLGDLYKGKNRQMDRKSQVCKLLGVILLLGTVMTVFSFTALYSHNENLFFGGVVVSILLSLSQFALIMREIKKYVMKKRTSIISLALGLFLGAAGCITGGSFLFMASESSLLGFGFMPLIFLALLANAHMSKRTKQSAQILGKILGLRRFIEVAEADRIRLLAKENPEYYYDILPYAYVMGLADQWAEIFEAIPIVKPDWYSSYQGSDFVFNAWLFSHVMSSCNRSVIGQVQIHTEGPDIGGAAFSSSGGGFSGGGFGGGGGGAW